jgi:hypothetical protein
MPYLPPNTLEHTAFPKVAAKDLATQARIVSELYRRMYPALDYYVLRKAMTPVAKIGDISGETGATKVDTLYNEAVDSSLASWQQPHLSGTLQAAEPELFDPPVKLHIRVQRITRETELKKQGFDKRRVLSAYIPTPLLDLAGIACKEGDYFMWDGRPYQVLLAEPTGYFKNSNIRMYVRLDCDSKKVGS